MRELLVTISDKEIVNKKQVRQFFGDLPTGKWLLKAERKDKRTSNQNRYLHLMFTMIQKGFYDLGYREMKTAEQAKYQMKELFLSYYMENETGGKIKMVRRTRDLTKEQMSEFIDECIQFAAENLSIAIPLPGEQVSFFKVE
jgi:hypothetical protein